MPPFRNSRALLLTLCLLAAQLADAEEAENSPEVDAAKKFQAYAKETAAAYEIKVRAAADGERRTVLREEPILRWTNPLGGRKPDA